MFVSQTKIKSDVKTKQKYTKQLLLDKESLEDIASNWSTRASLPGPMFDDAGPILWAEFGPNLQQTGPSLGFKIRDHWLKSRHRMLNSNQLCGKKETNFGNE